MPKQLADLNLYRDDQGHPEISLARARGILAELDDKAGMHTPGEPIQYADILILEAADRLRVRMGRPIPMVLHCPRCRMQHIDAPGPGWTNPPHRSHQCQNKKCRTVWRPSDLPTEGVAAVQTVGKGDTWCPPPNGFTEQQYFGNDEQHCSGHVASDDDPKRCRHCGVHVNSLRPPEDEPPEQPDRFSEAVETLGEGLR
jgi:hypothetical protein